jgi:tetratricopeptide (TPR) repeat protein
LSPGDSTPPGPTSTPSGANPLGFSLSFVEGTGVLALRDRRCGALGVCDHLELEIPDLKFPFDGSGGAGRFQHRRSRLRRARLQLSAADLAAFLATRPALREQGLAVTDLRLRDGFVDVGGTAQRSGATVAFTARAYLVPLGARAVRVALTDVRLFGHLAWPAGLMGRALLLGCVAGGGADGPHVQGLANLVIDPLDEALFGVMPPAGWRLPDVAAARLCALEVSAAGVVLEYGSGTATSPAVPERFAPHEEGLQRFAAVDEELARGSLEDGRRACVAAVQREGEHPYLVARLLEILAATPGGFDSATGLGHRTLEARPDEPAALLAQAAVFLARGQPAEAAAHFERVSDRAAALGDELEAVAAARAAADLLVGSDPTRATPLLERVLAAHPDDQACADAVASCLQRTRRFGDLAQLLARRGTRAAAAGALGEQRRLLAELGTVLLERLGDPVGAAAALARATELGADDGALWEALAHAREAAGDETGFLAALTRAAERWAAAGDAAREAAARSRAAARCEQRGELEPAARDYHRVLALRPDDVGAWRRLAAVEERRGQHADAAAALARALDLSERPSEQLELRRELARVALAGGALDAARTHLEAAARLDPRDAATRRMLVELATARGVPADLDAALAQAAEVAAGPDQADLLTRRGLLLWQQLDRPADALVVLENAVAAAPAVAAPPLRALCALHESRGDEEALRDALSRLLLVAADAPDLPELTCRAAELAVRVGDLNAARALAERAAEGAADPRRALRVLEEIQRVGRDSAGRIATLERRLAAEERSEDASTVATTLRELAAALLEAGRSAEAVSRLERALTLRPDHPAALRALAEACLAAGQAGRAAAACERWLELSPAGPAQDRAAVALQLGELREREGQDRAALDCFREALRVGAEGPAAARAWRAVVGLHRRRGEHEAAARALCDAAGDPHTLEAPRERAALLAAAADLLRRQLGDPARARACLEQALELGPELMPILDALEALEAAEGAHERVAAVLERKIAASARHADRCKALWARLGEVRAGPLHDAAGAREAWNRALEIDPGFRPALLRLARDAVARGDTEAAEPHYRALAGQPATPSDDTTPREEQIEPLVWLAERCHTTGRTAEAERLCARALDLQPRSAAVLALLDRLLADQGRHAELAEILRRRIDLALQSAEAGAVDRALDLELRRGAVLEQHLHRLPEATAAYRHVLRLQPAQRVALVRLGALLRRERNWRDLHGVLTRLADLAEQSADSAGVDAVGLRLELAEVARDGLGDPMQAEVHLRRALALDPRSRAALDGLIALHRGRGDVAALDDLLMRRLALEEDPTAAVALRLERARLLATARRGADALAILRALPLDSAPDEALRLRADLCEASGAHREAAETLEALRSRSQGRGDAATELAVARRLAALASGRGHDRAAEELWQRVLDLAPDDEEAIQALTAIYRHRRDGQRHAAMLERRLATARQRGAEAAALADLLCEVARVLLDGGDVGGARARVAEVATIAPDDRRVHRLAAEAAAAAGDHAAVAEALGHLARPAAGLDAAERADLLVELAGVVDERLGDPARAVAALREAVALYPPGARRQSALRRLASLAFAGGSFDVAAEAYAQLESRSPEDLARLAEAHERNGRLDDAAALWRELEQVGPLRARARARLVSLYRAAGAERELAAALERAAEDEAGDPDTVGRATAYREAAALHLAAGDAAWAVRCARQALALDDGAADLDLLSRALGGDVARVAEEIERLAGGAPPARRVALATALAALAEKAGDSAVAMRALTAAAEAEADPRRRAVLHLRRARLARSTLFDPPAAEAAIESALACDPEDAEVLGAAAEAAELKGDPTRAEELLGRRASRLEGRERRATLDHMAQLALRRGDATAFARHLEAVLVLEPNDERALAALAALRRTSGDAAGAAALYARLAEVARGDRRRAEFLVARGALLADPLRDLAGALECYTQAAAANPAPDTFASLAAVAVDLGRFEEAAVALERRVELLGNEQEWARGETLARLGAVRRHQGRDQAAREAFRQAAAVLREGTLWAEMLRRQVELALIAGDPLDALNALRTLADAHGASPAELAQLAELKAAVGAATTVVQPAAEAPPAAPEPQEAPPPADAGLGPTARTTLRLTSRASRPVQPEEAPATPAAAHLPAEDATWTAPEDSAWEFAADGVPEPMGPLETAPLHLSAHNTRPVATIAFLRRRVEQAATEGDDAALEKATAELWDRLPGDPLAFQHRRRLLRDRAEHAELTDLMRTRIRHSGDREERLQLWCELSQVLDEVLDDLEGAKQALESALAESSDHPAALEALADLCFRGHELPRARELYARLGDRGVRLAPDALAHRRGELAEAANDRADARLFYLTAAETNPASLEARESLARLALVEGDRPAAIRWLKQVEALLPLTQVARRTDVRHQLAELHARAGEPGIARVYLELVLAENQDSASALELAAGVYAQLGQWELAARALERLSFVVESVERRADLLYRRGEIYRRRLNDPERATDCYLKAIDLAPDHAPTIRRVVDHYWSAGDWASVSELGGDLARTGPPLADASTFGLRWALATVLASRDLATAQTRLGRVPLDAEEIRGLLSHVAVRQAATGAPLELLDGPLALLGAVGGERLLSALLEELAHYLQSHPGDSGCRRVLGRLLEQRGSPLRARSHYAVCVFLAPQDPARARLEALGPPGPPAAEALAGMGAAVHPDVRGPLRRLLTLLSPALATVRPGKPQLIGPPLDEAAAPLPYASVERIRLQLGVGALNVHWVGDAGVTVAVETSRPPRVLVSRAAASLPQAEFQFLVARGLELMRSGGLLLQRLKDEELAAILSALAADFVPHDHPLTGLGRSFAELLASAGIRSESLPAALRTQMAEDLESYFAGPADLAAIRRGQECSADRIGLLASGDPAAALRARARLEGAEDDTARAALLERSELLRALVDFATSAEIEACYQRG